MSPFIATHWHQYLSLSNDMVFFMAGPLFDNVRIGCWFSAIIWDKVRPLLCDVSQNLKMELYYWWAVCPWKAPNCLTLMTHFIDVAGLFFKSFLPISSPYHMTATVPTAIPKRYESDKLLLYLLTNSWSLRITLNTFLFSSDYSNRFKKKL